MSLNPPLRDWHGRRAWLIGASSGIGRATAAALHARGAQVIVSARSGDALDAFAAQHPGSVACPAAADDQHAGTRFDFRRLEANRLHLRHPRHA